MGLLCEVCEHQEKKYTCPKCNTNTIVKEEDSIKAAERAKLENVTSMIHVDPDDDKELIVPEEKLKKLRDSSELKALLKNQHLRDFLLHINTTHSPEGFMRYAMREPLFMEFSDVCLKVLHPETAPAQELTDKQVLEKLQEAIDEDE